MIAPGSPPWPRPSRPPGLRRGLISAVLVMALFALILIAGGLVRVAALRLGEVRASERRLQAEWLAESALDRAAARLSARPDYPGETWDVPASEIGGPDGGTVVIEVKPVPGRPDRRSVRVRADYPRDAPRRARESRALTIAAAPSSAPRPGPTDPAPKGDAPR